MSRARQTFKRTDITKAVLAVVAAGLSVARVEIEGGKIVVFAGTPEQDAATLTPLDQWRRERGQG
jgi:predicted metal-dependent RNase